MYLFPDHDIILVVAVVCIPQFTCEKTSNDLTLKHFSFNLDLAWISILTNHM